jgi:hypothetical protein
LKINKLKTLIQVLNIIYPLKNKMKLREITLHSIPVLITLTVSLLLVQPSFAVMSVPTDKESFSYAAVFSPVLNDEPLNAKPLSVGSVSEGGDILNVNISLNKFDGPVDIYCAFSLSTNPNMISVLNPDGSSFNYYTVQEILSVLSANVLPAGIKPWMADVKDKINKHLFTTNLSTIPPGIYHIYLLVTPADSLNNYYLWNTNFSGASGKASFIDEPIVLEVSEGVSGTEIIENEFLFDLSSIPMVVNKTFNDIEVAYGLPDTCDSPLYLYNFNNQDWDQLAFVTGSGCFAVLMTGFHTVRDLYGDVESYVDETGSLRIKRGEHVSPYAVRVLHLNENYFAKRPLGETNIDVSGGLTYDGIWFWASSNASNRIYKINHNGKVVNEFDSPSGYPFGMAFDGKKLWVADGTDKIFQITRNGNVLCEFSVPTDYPGGLAWGDNSLWLAEYPSPGLIHTFQIDPFASCASGSAVITRTFITPGGGSRGLAWDGENLLIASIKNKIIYRVNKEGTVLEEYALPVNTAQGLAWDGENIAFFSNGPKGYGNWGAKLNKFRLR